MRFWDNRQRARRVGLPLCVLGAAGILLTAILVCTSVVQSSSRTVLRFRPDISIGTVALERPSRDEASWGSHVPWEWERFAEARGEVSIPLGRVPILCLPEDIAENLPALDQLADVPIHTLVVPAHGAEVLAALKPMPSLKGLLFTSYDRTSLPYAELRKFPGLERLMILGDPLGMAQISQLKELRQLCIVGVGSADELAVLADLPLLEELYLSSSSIDATALSKLTTLEKLTRLQLNVSSLPPEGYAQLAACKSLKDLRLAGPGLKPAGCGTLCTSKMLESIRVRGWGVADQDLTDLAKIPTLRIVEVSGFVEEEPYHKLPTITDAGIKELAKLRNLEELSLAHGKITGEGAGYLATLPGLRKLQLSSNVDDEVLMQIGKMISLEELALSRGTFTSDGAKALAGLPRLRRLYLPCGVRDDVLAALTQSKSISDLEFCHEGKYEGILVLGRLQTLKHLDYHGKQYEWIIEGLRSMLPELVISGGGFNALPAGGVTVWRAFQDALRQERWDQALSFCTDRVRKEAAAFGHVGFFKEVVPVEAITAIEDAPRFFSTYEHNETEGECISYQGTSSFRDFGPVVHAEWHWSMRHAGDSWLVDFESRPLSELLADAAVKAAKDAELEKEGMRLFKGVSIKLTATRPKCTLGEPMLVRLDLINSGAYWIYCDAQGTQHGGLDVTNEKGERSRYIRPPIQSGGGPTPLGPGESRCIYENRDLTQWYDLSQPGKYSVQLTKGTLGMFADPSGQPPRYSIDSEGRRTGVFEPKKQIPAPRDLVSNTLRIEIAPK